jgi:hypothetical protein
MGAYAGPLLLSLQNMERRKAETNPPESLAITCYSVHGIHLLYTAVATSVLDVRLCAIALFVHGTHVPHLTRRSRRVG